MQWAALVSGKVKVRQQHQLEADLNADVAVVRGVEGTVPAAATGWVIRSSMRCVEEHTNTCAYHMHTCHLPFALTGACHRSFPSGGLPYGIPL